MDGWMEGVKEGGDKMNDMTDQGIGFVKLARS